MVGKCFLLGSVLLVSAQLNAATFSGSVCDQKGSKLEGVSVSLYENNNTVRTVTTDSAGAWTIEYPDQSPKTLVFAKTSYSYEQLLNQSPAADIEITLRSAVKSAATIREQQYVQDDCSSVTIPENVGWNANFKISPLKGDLAPDNTYTRRDPSAVIEVNGVYYVWYSFSLTHDINKIAPWDLNDLYYATSEDGMTWTEQGLAVGRGESGSFDHRSAFTTEVLARDGKYYLVYQAAADKNGVYNRNTIAMASAPSPDGPWTKLPEPVLTPTYTEDLFFDNNAVHDPCIIPYMNQFYLYYKGECNCRGKEGCQRWCNPVCGLKKQVKWGVAIADKPTGPYVKSNANPITNTGHEVMVWRYQEGVAILQHQDGPEPNTIQFSQDGLNFEIMGKVSNIPEAAGLARTATSTDDPLAGIRWGLGHKLMWNAGPRGWMYLYRFDAVSP